MATYKEDTGNTIDEAFKKFHKENPDVYNMFKEQVYRAVRKKKDKFSANAIFNWIRWEVSLKIKTEEEWKINNNFSSRYARLYVKDHPEHEFMFNFRELRSDPTAPKPKRKLEDSLERILRELWHGAIIRHHLDNDTVGMISGNSKKIPITNPQFNRLKKKKLIAETGQKSIVETRYGLSSWGKEVLKTLNKKAA